VRTNDRRQAPIAECHALERRWAELHEEALHLDQEWQHLLSIISRVESKRNGQALNWTDGAAAFYDLDKHAARTAHLAQEALQTCHWYALALQRALDACTRCDETEVVSAGAEPHPRVVSPDRLHRHALHRRRAGDAGAGEDRHHDAPAPDRAHLQGYRPPDLDLAKQV
jgi:hypothetical protein